jgi:hypothetical protein
MNLKLLLLKYSLVSCIFYIIMSSIIIKYVIELEKKNCECSNYWYRDFIKNVTCILVVIVIIYIFNQKKFLTILKNSNILLLLTSILKFIGLIYFAILIIYFLKLKNSDCRCSNDWKRKTFLYPILIFSLAMILFIFFMMKHTIHFLLD